MKETKLTACCKLSITDYLQVTCRDSGHINFKEFIKCNDHNMKNSQCESLLFLSNPRDYT